MVAFHVASGAAAGAALRSAAAAALAGPLLHYAFDRVPHRDVSSHRFEFVTGATGVLLLAATHGPVASATVGAVASSLPDVEHAVRLPRPGGRKLFPSHRGRGRPPPGGVSTGVQALLSGLMLGAVLASRLRPRG